MMQRGIGIGLACLAAVWVLRCGVNLDGSLQDVGGGDTAAPDAGGDGHRETDGTLADLPEGPDGLVGLTVCNQGDLETALRDAQATGAEVVVGAGCVIEGTFTVPAGVSLRGEAGAVLATPADERVRRPVLTVQAAEGTGTTSVVGLTIRSSSNYGVAVRGASGGQAQLKDLVVEATRGVGVGAENLDALELTNVALDGGHTAGELRRSDPSSADPASEATHGLVIVRGDATIERVTIRGFASIGVVMIDDDIAWSGGVVEDNGLAGLVTHGARVQVTGVAVRGLRMPGAFPIETTYGETRSWSGPVTFGAAFLGGSTVQTTGLVVERGLDFGVAQEGGEATHDGLTVRECGAAAVWAQGIRSFTLRGTAGAPALLEDNRFAGVALIEPSAVAIADLSVAGTGWGCQACGTLEEVRAGDGIQVALPKGAVTIQRAELSNNARIGLLLDMGGISMSSVDLAEITVAGGERSYGAYAQNAVDDAGWDEGISRTEPLAFNDRGIDGGILAVGRPLPAKAFPAVSRIAREGLIGIMDPDPPH